MRGILSAFGIKRRTSKSLVDYEGAQNPVIIIIVRTKPRNLMEKKHSRKTPKGRAAVPKERTMKPTNPTTATITPMTQQAKKTTVRTTSATRKTKERATHLWKM